MKCFRCDANMKKTSRAGIVIDVCDSCKGIWLDGGELEMLVEGQKKENHELLQEAAHEIRREKTEGITVQGMCPKCQDAALRLIHRDHVELDFCPACKGIYFDHGELRSVLDGGSTETFLDKVTNCFRSLLGR